MVKKQEEIDDSEFPEFESEEEDFEEQPKKQLPPSAKKSMKTWKDVAEEAKEDADELEFEEEPIRKPVSKMPPKRMPTKPELDEAIGEEAEPIKVKPALKPHPQSPQYVAIPRAVSIEAMLNEIYDGQQEMKQILNAILERIGQ
jgi:hypothetical protein